jgi:hypothetical protein
MKVLKLLAAPAALLFGLVFAVPASAHVLTNVTVTLACQQPSGQVCVTLSGDIPATGNDARKVFFDLFATGSNTPLNKTPLEIDVPASNGKAQHFTSKPTCFDAVSGNIASLTVEVVKVTDTQGNLSDLKITIGSGPNAPTITFTAQSQPETPVGTTGTCSAAQSPTPGTPTPTPTGGNGGGSPTPSANTTVALAQTGGFDFRFPLIGLVLLVAGGALFVVSASRGRSADTK